MSRFTQPNPDVEDSMDPIKKAHDEFSSWWRRGTNKNVPVSEYMVSMLLLAFSWFYYMEVENKKGILQKYYLDQTKKIRLYILWLLDFDDKFHKKLDIRIDLSYPITMGKHRLKHPNSNRDVEGALAATVLRMLAGKVRTLSTSNYFGHGTPEQTMINNITTFGGDCYVSDKGFRCEPLFDVWAKRFYNTSHSDDMIYDPDLVAERRSRQDRIASSSDRPPVNVRYVNAYLSGGRRRSPPPRDQDQGHNSPPRDRERDRSPPPRDRERDRSPPPRDREQGRSPPPWGREQGRSPPLYDNTDELVRLRANAMKWKQDQPSTSSSSAVPSLPVSMPPPPFTPQQLLEQIHQLTALYNSLPPPTPSEMATALLNSIIFPPTGNK